MPSSFAPQSIGNWPADRAVLFVHGIGNASEGGIGAFPIEAFKTAMGADAGRFAIYHLNYDFINDWAVVKTNLTAGVLALKNAIAKKFGSDDLATTIAEYIGDVLWPVLSTSLRLAIRDALISQLQQIHLDAGEAALARGDDPLDYKISVVAHSLGCFHTYEALTATVADAQYKLRPARDLFQLESLFLMASPVQVIRTIGGDIRLLVPNLDTLATLSKPLAIPSETVGTRTTPCAKQFFAVTGSQDPVGGHLLGVKQKWGYMALPDQPSIVQQSVIQPEVLVGVDPKAALKAALKNPGEAGVAGAVQVNDPHSWTNYISTQTELLRKVLT